MRAIRTYSDLLDLVSTLLHRSVRNRSIHHREVQFRAVLTGTAGSGVLHRSGWLTAYATECLAEDARRAGRGCWLDVMLGAGANPFWEPWLEERLVPLSGHGVRVRILSSPSQDAPGAPRLSTDCSGPVSDQDVVPGRLRRRQLRPSVQESGGR